MNNARLLCQLLMLLLIGPCLIQHAGAQACRVSATSVSFGIYNPAATLANDISGTVTVVCQATVALLVTYTVKLNGGTGGNISARKMFTSGSQLTYQIYMDALHTSIWGDGTGGSSYNVGRYLLSAMVPVTNTFTAYGRVSALQNAYAGSYQDTLTILVSY